VDRLRAEGIATGVHYHRNDEYSMYEKTELPAAASFASSVMSLPMHLDLRDEDVGTISDAIRSGW
jgi:dTDP-4-amino-4,6-dideoxygalactose transaminase